MKRFLAAVFRWAGLLVVLPLLVVACAVGVPCFMIAELLEPGSVSRPPRQEDPDEVWRRWNRLVSRN